MVKIRPLLLFLFAAWLSSQSLRAQPAPGPPFQFTVAPPSNSVFIAETTNVVKVTVGDWENVTNRYTNFVIIGFVSTNGYPTNILTTNNVAGTNVFFRFADVGRPPDETPDDGVFVGNVIARRTTVATNLVLRIVVSAEDLMPTDPPVGTNVAIVSVTNSINYIVIPRPVNDAFTNAFKIDSSGGVSTGTNNFASLEAGEKLHANVQTVAASVWWTWSAGTTTNVLVDTAGSSFNPVLAVYTGDSITNLVAVAFSTNDVLNRLHANVNFDAVKGATYRIAVSGYDTNGFGDVRVRVTPGAQPDTSPPALVITSPNRETLSAVEQITIIGTAREGSTLESGIERVMLQVNSLAASNAAGTLNWSGSVTLPPGTNVIRAFAVDFAGNVSVADAIVVRFVSPTNDLFSSAGRITGVGGVFNAQTRTARREAGEPLHAGNEGGHSIWYSFRSASVGTLFLTTANSTFDTILGIYTGDSVTNLTEVASNDDAFEGSRYSELLITTLSNQLYYVVVDGYGGTFGTSVLQVQFVAPAPGQFFSVNVDSLAGGTASPPGGVYPSNSRVTLTATPDRDYEFVGWEGSVLSPVNPLTLTVNSNLALLARFRVVTTNYTDNFESGALLKLNWQNSTNTPWVVQTNSVSSGKFAARSGTISHNQFSSLILVTNTSAGTASFDLRVSSEPEWDYLEFLLNGVRKQRWSGETGWTNFPFAITAGTNRLEWRYGKDINFSAGLDAAFIDNLYIPISLVGPTTTPTTLSLQFLPNRQAQLTVVGEPARNYTIESSTDMIIWLGLVTTNSPSGVIQFLDRQSPNLRSRFYRTVTQ